MRDVMVDTDGNLRCWSCGGKSLVNSRNKMGRKVAVLGIFALLAPKKHLRCQQCGQMNRTGFAKPYVNPKIGWWPDPMGRFEKRYHDGTAWTDQVTGPNGAAVDPLN